MGEIASKFTKLKRSTDKLKNKEGQLFRQHFQLFLQISKERIELAQRLRGNNLIQTSEEKIDARIEEFHHVCKIPVLEAVLWKHDLAFHLDDPIFLAFDTFNVASDFDIQKRIKCTNVLKELYGQPQQSTFNNETNVSNPVNYKTQLNDDIIKSFFTNFHAEVKCKGELCNSKICKLIQGNKLKPENIDQCKEENPISPESVYASLMKECVQYPDLLVLFKLFTSNYNKHCKCGKRLLGSYNVGNYTTK